jgi:hypothetical protein
MLGLAEARQCQLVLSGKQGRRPRASNVTMASHHIQIIRLLLRFHYKHCHACPRCLILPIHPHPSPVSTGQLLPALRLHPLLFHESPSDSTVSIPSRALHPLRAARDDIADFDRVLPRPVCLFGTRALAFGAEGVTRHMLVMPGRQSSFRACILPFKSIGTNLAMSFWDNMGQGHAHRFADTPSGSHTVTHIRLVCFLVDA